MHFLFNIEWTTSFARTAFILLFIILIIGPLFRIKVPSKKMSPMMNPWSWRGELGIWFTIMALAHFILLLIEQPLTQLIKIGGSGYSLTNFIGLIALIISIILSFASLGKVIKFLGVISWKVLHSLTYVVFYLVASHLIYFQFFSSYGKVGPDWFGWISVVAMTLVVILQIIAFVKIVTKQNKIR
ncbi:ferric reductase-like transmembrane domain-containing protein [Patescibacteria group bacterium]|nr:ferric reductase-like transmembrane domain-containing protein [Patescibacteria group bacterium]